MELKNGKTLHRRTWFGLHATITVGPGFVHRAGVGKILIPHPPVINWLLRRGLSDRAGLQLSFLHEMGHFQTAPFIALYAIAALTGAFTAGGFKLPRVLFVLVGIQAAWELFSEALTIIGDISYYRKCYEGAPQLPRITFWTAAGILAAGALFIAFA